MTTPGKNPDPLSRLIAEGQPKTPLPPLSDDGGGATNSGGLPDRNQDFVRARNATTGAAARRTGAGRSVNSDVDREPDAHLATDPSARSASKDAGAADVPSGARQTPEIRENTTGARAAMLDELVPSIESARLFAERWDERYRVHVFGIALERLLNGNTTMELPRDTATTSQKKVGAMSTPATPQRTVGTGTAEDGFGAPEKLARSLDVDIDFVERLVKFAEDGKFHLLARIDGKTKKELQTRYSLVYLYVKEVALGDRMVDIEELRSLCIEHACYDLANFTGNFSKDVTAGLLRQQGEKGARSRKFLLSKRGLDEAAALLRELAT